MKWLKLHTEARNDAKLESLADDEFRVWFRLLCFAGDQPERGIIMGYSERLLAVEVARGNVELLRRTLQALTELNIVECIDGGASFVHWDDRQYDKPSDQPGRVSDRVARYRERQRNAPLPISNADVTPSNADVTRSNDIDTDTDTDTDNTPLTPQGAEQPVDNFTPQFDWFLAHYPFRDGKKLYQSKIKAALKAIKPRDWDLLETCVTNFAASSQAKRNFAPDAHRWLARDDWKVWAMPETPPASSPSTNGYSDDGYIAPQRGMNAEQTKAYTDELRALRDAKNRERAARAGPAPTAAS
jgi:hypothetical protein